MEMKREMYVLILGLALTLALVFAGVLIQMGRENMKLRTKLEVIRSVMEHQYEVTPKSIIEIVGIE